MAVKDQKQGKKFRTVFGGGYNKDDVNEYIESMQAQFESIEETLKSTINHQKTQLDQARAENVNGKALEEELAVVKDQLTDTAAARIAAEEEKADAEKTLEALRDDLDGMKAEREEALEKAARASEELSALQTALAEAKDEAEKQRTAAETADAAAKTADQAAAALAQKLSAAEEALASRTEEQNLADSERAAVTAERAAAAAERLAAQNEKAALEEQIRTLLAEKKALEDDRTAIEQEKAVLAEQNAALLREAAERESTPAEAVPIAPVLPDDYNVLKEKAAGYDRMSSQFGAVLFRANADAEEIRAKAKEDAAAMLVGVNQELAAARERAAAVSENFIESVSGKICDINANCCDDVVLELEDIRTSIGNMIDAVHDRYGEIAKKLEYAKAEMETAARNAVCSATAPRTLRSQNQEQ